MALSLGDLAGSLPHGTHQATNVNELVRADTSEPLNAWPLCHLLTGSVLLPLG